MRSTGSATPPAELDRLLADLAAAEVRPPLETIRGWNRALAELSPPARGEARPCSRWSGALIGAATLLVTLAALWPTTSAPHPQAGDGQALGSTGPRPDEPNLAGLADPARRAGCLALAGAAGVSVLGGRRIEWWGHPAVALLLAGGPAGRPRVLVVSPDCASGRGVVWADSRRRSSPVNR